MPRLSYNLKWIAFILLNILIIWWISFVLAQPELQGINIYIRISITIILITFFIWIIKFFAPSWEKGASGEHWVSQEINKLPKEYLSINDFHKGKKGNVDFIVIGPTGIYTLEVKNTNKGLLEMKNDHLYINGSKFEGKDYLNQAYAEAKSIQEHIHRELNLSLPVIPVLVFANSRVKMHFGMHPHKGVYIIGINWVTKLIQEGQLDERFTPELNLKIKANLNKYGCDII